jgi:hypothetical protein
MKSMVVHGSIILCTYLLLSKGGFYLMCKEKRRIFEDIELLEGEEVSEETLVELSDGKGEDNE